MHLFFSVGGSKFFSWIGKLISKLHTHVIPTHRLKLWKNLYRIGSRLSRPYISSKPRDKSLQNIDLSCYPNIGTKIDSAIEPRDKRLFKFLWQTQTKVELRHSIPLHFQSCFIYDLLLVLPKHNHRFLHTTEGFTDLGKLNFPMVVWFLAWANFQNCPSCLQKQCYV